MSNPTIHRNFWTVLSRLQDKFPGGIILRHPHLENYYQMACGSGKHEFPPRISVFWDSAETATTRGHSGIHVLQEWNPNVLCLDALNPNLGLLQGWLKSMHENVVASCYSALHACGYEMGTTALESQDILRCILGTDLIGEAGGITIVAGHPATGKSRLLFRMAYDHLSCGGQVVYHHESSDRTLIRRYEDIFGGANLGQPCPQFIPQTSETFTIPDVPPGTLVILDSVVAYPKLDWATIKEAILGRQVHLVVGAQLPRTATPETWRPITRMEQVCDVIACTSGLNKPLYISKHRTRETGWVNSPIIPMENPHAWTPS